MKENDDFSIEVHCFFNKLRKNNLEITNKEELYIIVNNLKNRTETQKRRFLLFYGLMPNSNKKLTFKEIGEIENCSYSAIRLSVIRVKSEFTRIDEKEKDIMYKIMKGVL